MKYQHELSERLSKCDNIILEAKRVQLNKQLDRIADITLSEKICTAQNVLTSKCSSDNEYTSSSSISPESILEGGLSESNELAHGKKSITILNSSDLQLNSLSNNIILKKYFEKWKSILQKEKVQTEKLDDFINNLKNHQHEFEPPPKSASKQSKSSNSAKPVGCFKNRYKTQKTIIDVQKSKIEEQSKIISELKLGIIREDLLKSMENTKYEIRELFSNCSDKLMSRASSLFKAVDERDQIMIQSQKAPKTVQKMQQRAIERAQYREIILERKRLLEAARQKLLEEAIEKKKVLEEDERKRNLEIISEQRKRELHLQKIRHAKREEFERKVSMARNFYNKLLMQQCFRKLFNYYRKSKENFTLATEYYLNKQKHLMFNAWLGYVESIYQIKYDIADAQFEYKALTSAFKKWKEFKLDCVRSTQVAEDVYDFRLTSNTFIYWHRYVCKQIMLDSKKIQIATKHHNRRLLFQYFYQWRSLPAVLQLEKAKEEKKRKWREKVWEILPDYKPPEQF